jgi:hypothetical protein
MEAFRGQPCHRDLESYKSIAIDTALGKRNQLIFYRGVTADKLKNSDIWWHGPSWLSKPPHHWPLDTSTTDNPLPEARKLVHQALTVKTPPPFLDDTRYSTYSKLLRITAWVLRFKQNIMQKQRTSGELTASELANARLYWLQVVQREHFTMELDALLKSSPLPEESKIARFNPFLDDGLVRLGGRTNGTVKVIGSGKGAHTECIRLQMDISNGLQLTLLVETGADISQLKLENFDKQGNSTRTV